VRKSLRNVWKNGNSYFLKYFLFKNILKYFFIFKKLFLILAYQNNLKTIKKLI